MIVSQDQNVRNIWERLDAAIHAQKHVSSLDVWRLAEEHQSIAKYRPMPAPKTELAVIETRHGAKTYMLRNIENSRYISFGEKELFIWNLMDGKRTVKDLYIELTMEYGLIGQEILLSFIRLLKENGFLHSKPTSILQSIAAQMSRHKFMHQARRVVSYVLHFRLVTRRADVLFEKIYQRIAPIFRHKGTFILAAALLIINLLLSSYLIFVKHEHLLITPDSGPGSHDVMVMMIVTYLSILIHEIAHGLAVKHYGRRVLRAGFMLLFGSPIAYVDTTDIWMRGRLSRIGVSLAGPCINGVIGAVLLLKSVILPESIYENLMIHAGLLNSVLFVINLIPFSETDGHYVIQDWFEQPQLRQDSLEFVRRGMWQKIRGHEKWNKADFGHFVYGLIGVFGIFYMAVVGIHLWWSTGRHLLAEAWQRPQMVIEVLVFVAALIVLSAGINWHRRNRNNINKLLNLRLKA